MARQPPSGRLAHMLAHPEESLGFLLKQVHHLMRLGIEARMRQADLHMTHAHAVTLHSLMASPGASGAELARAATVTPQTMNSILVTLEQQGMIIRQPDARHGRILATFVTDKGRRQFGRGVGAAEGFIEEMEASLSDSERQQLRRLLQRCLANLSLITGIAIEHPVPVPGSSVQDKQPRRPQPRGSAAKRRARSPARGAAAKDRTT